MRSRTARSARLCYPFSHLSDFTTSGNNILLIRLFIYFFQNGPSLKKQVSNSSHLVILCILFYFLTLHPPYTPCPHNNCQGWSTVTCYPEYTATIPQVITCRIARWVGMAWGEHGYHNRPRHYPGGGGGGGGGGGTPYVMGDTYVPRFWPPFFTLAGSSTIFLGYFFSSTNTKTIFWCIKTTNS